MHKHIRGTTSIRDILKRGYAITASDDPFHPELGTISSEVHIANEILSAFKSVFILRNFSAYYTTDAKLDEPNYGIKMINPTRFHFKELSFDVRLSKKGKYAETSVAEISDWKSGGEGDIRFRCETPWITTIEVEAEDIYYTLEPSEEFLSRIDEDYKVQHLSNPDNTPSELSSVHSNISEQLSDDCDWALKDLSYKLDDYIHNMNTSILLLQYETARDTLTGAYVKSHFEDVDSTIRSLDLDIHELLSSELEIFKMSDIDLIISSIGGFIERLEDLLYMDYESIDAESNNSWLTTHTTISATKEQQLLLDRIKKSFEVLESKRPLWEVSYNNRICRERLKEHDDRLFKQISIIEKKLSFAIKQFEYDDYHSVKMDIEKLTELHMPTVYSLIDKYINFKEHGNPNSETAKNKLSTTLEKIENNIDALYKQIDDIDLILFEAEIEALDSML